MKNNDFFVQIVRSDGCLGKLFGPATWDEAIAKVKAYVAFNGGPVEGETEEQVVAFIENDGSYDWGNGEGIFIVQIETIDAPFGSEDEDEDEDEEQRRDEKNGLYGHHVDDSN